QETNETHEKHELIPDAVIVQHAGSIGYFSGGIGYELFKNKKGNLDLLYGHLPRRKGGNLDIVTAKFAYRPFKIRINDVAVIYPANPGVFLSYTFGENLSFTFDKDQYSRGYYGWSEALRSHLSISNELELSGKNLFNSKRNRSLVFYSEFNANDLYLVSWATNRDGLSFFKIFKLGVGAKVKF
ncbi:MAG TPA: hypothetical protein VGD31_12560, partial [Sphingobacteriaceae bacterium]